MDPYCNWENVQRTLRGCPEEIRCQRQTQNQLFAASEGRAEVSCLVVLHRQIFGRVRAAISLVTPRLVMLQGKSRNQSLRDNDRPPLYSFIPSPFMPSHSLPMPLMTQAALWKEVFYVTPSLSYSYPALHRAWLTG